METHADRVVKQRTSDNLQIGFLEARGAIQEVVSTGSSEHFTVQLQSDKHYLKDDMK